MNPASCETVWRACPLPCDLQDLERAHQYHQYQLEIAQEQQDRAAQGRASSNLGGFVWKNKLRLKTYEIERAKERKEACWLHYESVHQLSCCLVTWLSYWSFASGFIAISWTDWSLQSSLLEGSAIIALCSHYLTICEPNGGETKEGECGNSTIIRLHRRSGGRRDVGLLDSLFFASKGR